MNRKLIATLGVAVFALCASACGEDATIPAGTGKATPVHTKLSEYGLFTDLTESGAVLTPAVGGIPYDLNTPLFSDYSLKYRVLHIPEGTQAHYREREVFEFPVGTIISKTFSFPADLREPEKDVRRVETRLLIHQPQGWTALAYIWNDEQTEATAAYGGRVTKIGLVNTGGESLEFNYAVPAKNQCGTCHHLYKEVEQTGRTVRKQMILPIGPKARHINKSYEYPEKGSGNQIEYLAQAGKLTKLPLFGGIPRMADYSDETKSVDERARAYLDANCGHCHTQGNSTGINSKLLLDIHENDWTNLGVCKTPGSAGKGGGGLRYDIVPGSPEDSILYFRTASVDPGAMMPQLGRSLAHTEGVELLYRWIAEMPQKDCP
ncbi:MAG: SO2930 family diheme c-type cytochrome [Leptospirales bacterium]|jgi:uncharacterized repeat protein (TIGR03806 family)